MLVLIRISRYFRLETIAAKSGDESQSKYQQLIKYEDKVKEREREISELKQVNYFFYIARNPDYLIVLCRRYLHYRMKYLRSMK
jgi:hypothetical protein